MTLALEPRFKPDQGKVHANQGGKECEKQSKEGQQIKGQQLAEQGTNNQQTANSRGQQGPEPSTRALGVEPCPQTKRNRRNESLPYSSGLLVNCRPKRAVQDAGSTADCRYARNCHRQGRNRDAEPCDPPSPPSRTKAARLDAMNSNSSSLPPSPSSRYPNL